MPVNDGPAATAAAAPPLGGVVLVIAEVRAATPDQLDLLAGMVGAGGGAVIDRAGGGSLLARFADPGAALRFAVAAQRCLSAAAAAAAAPCRIGMHLGDVREAEGRLYGHAINVTRRIEELAPDGGICLSEALAAALPPEPGVRLRPLGQPPLKNIAERPALFAVEAAGLGRGPVGRAPTPPARGEPAVAVPPFGGDPRLGAALAADAALALSRFRDLRVHGPPGSPAEDEGAAYVVAGDAAAEPAGKPPLLRARLIAPGGRLVWAAELKGSPRRIAGALAAGVAVRLALEERRAREGSGHGLVHGGLELSRAARRDRLRRAQGLLERAARLDPSDPRPHAGLAVVRCQAWRQGWEGAAENPLGRALAHAAAAVARDAEDARAHGALGLARLCRREHALALAAHRHALLLNPHDPDLLAGLGDALTHDGDPARGLESLEAALRLNPCRPDWYLRHLAAALVALGRPREAVAALRRARDPDADRALLAAAHAQLGEPDEAAAQARAVLRLQPGFRLAGWAERQPHRRPEDLGRLLEALRLAGLPEG